MILVTINENTYVLNVKIPDCKCARWARIFENSTGHHPNCEHLPGELELQGFLRIVPKNCKFACRVRSDTKRKILNVFRQSLHSAITPKEIITQADTLECLRDLICDYVNTRESGFTAKPLMIDSILYMRYYRDEEFVFHEEYSYIEDEHEAKKIYRRQD